MSDSKNPLRVLTESGPLIAVTVAVAMLVAIVMPASAQFFPFGFDRPPPRPQYQQQQQRGFGDFFSPFRSSRSRPLHRGSTIRARRRRRPTRATLAPERHVLVLGDAMADWLAYGLEDAFSEQPDMGVIRKHRTVSGLIRYSPRGEPADWAAAAKGIVAQEKSDVIVVMLGLHDRTTIREPVVEKPDPKKDDKKKADSKAGAKQDARRPSTAKKPDEDAEAPPAEDQADSTDTPSIAAPERTARSANGLNEFRSERWVELYKKKIEDMIGVLKTKGVPVLWVGLPAVRGPKATSDMLFLDSLYRESASKAGITYVDVWDGFVDEAGRFMQQGPDFEGQTRATAHRRRRVLHQGRRAQARPLCRPRDQAPAGEPRAAGGAAERSGHARHQHQARRPCAAAARRPDRAAGCVLGRHQRIARRRRHKARRDRCARRAHAGQGRAAGSARRTRRRCRLAAPRGRQDRRQGRCPGCRRCAGERWRATAAATAAATDQPKPVKRRPRPAVTNTEQGSWPGFHTAAAAAAGSDAASASSGTTPARPGRPRGVCAGAAERLGRILHPIGFNRL